MALFHTTVVDNQIKALDTIGSVSGAICTFDTDRAERLVNLEVAITATGGGGTPVSPIAINGFSACDLVACGKNICNLGTITGTRNTEQYVDIPIGTFTISFVATSSDTDASTCSIVFIYADNTLSTAIQFNRGTRESYTFTNSKRVTSIRFYASDNYSHSTGDTFSFTDIQIEKGNTPTTYEAYNGTTETIPFGQTVYGGRLNVGSGVLTVTYDISDLGALNWAYDSTNKRFVALLANAKLNRDGYAYTNIKSKCSQYEIFFTDREYSYNEMISAIANENNIIWLYTANSQSYVDVKDTTYTDAPTFKTAMNGVKFVYELETPITIQLDSKQIESIIGTNNIYADTGDIIDLKFILSVGQAIS